MVIKLDTKQKTDVLTMYKYKVAVKDIAAKMDVDYTTIKRVIKEYDLMPNNDGSMALVQTSGKMRGNRVFDRPRSKYPLLDMGIDETIVVEGDLVKLKRAADGFRVRWGFYFLVQDNGNNTVKITRYK